MSRGKAITEQDYAKIKKWTRKQGLSTDDVVEATGYSRTSVGRVKRSKDYADYLQLRNRDVHNEPKPKMQTSLIKDTLPTEDIFVYLQQIEHKLDTVLKALNKQPAKRRLWS